LPVQFQLRFRSDQSFGEDIMTPFENIGGESVAHAVLDDFFQRAQADDRLADVYGPVITAGGRAFVTVALDAAATAEHPDLEPALAWLGEVGLGDDELDLVIGHLAAALEAVGVNDEVIAEIAEEAEALRDAALAFDPEDDEDEDEDEEVAA
jgi:truncated hemoglobin YjbI